MRRFNSHLFAAGAGVFVALGAMVDLRYLVAVACVILAGLTAADLEGF